MIIWTSCPHSLKGVRNKSFNFVCCSGVSLETKKRCSQDPRGRTRWWNTSHRNRSHCLLPPHRAPAPHSLPVQMTSLARPSNMLVLLPSSNTPHHKCLPLSDAAKLPMGSCRCRKHTGLGRTSWVTKSVSTPPVPPLSTTLLMILVKGCYFLPHTHWKPDLKTLLQLWAFL